MYRKTTKAIGMCLNKQDASQAVLLLKICDGSKQQLKISSAPEMHI